MTSTAQEARRSLAGHTIWLWHYLHADWQWEQSRAWHEDRYALAVSEVLDLMRVNPEITYFFDTASEFFEPVMRKLASRMEELRERVAEGRIRIVSAQVANARPNQVGDETYIRNLQLGRAFFEATLPATDLSLFHSVDIAIGHTQMPQILALAGFRYYRAWRPHGPMNARGIPHQFVWEGIDGSRILVTRGAYGGLYLNEHVPEGYQEHWDAAVAGLYDHMFRDQVLLDRSPSKHLWMIQGSDDSRPLRTWQGDRPIDLFGFIEEWRRREQAPIRWCTPLEYSQAVAAALDHLPVVRGVLDGSDCSYNAANGGSNGLWHRRQMNDRVLLRAEWWIAAAAAVGHQPPTEQLRQLWHEHLVYQAHAEEFAFREDLDELLTMARNVTIQAERLEQSALKAIVAAAGGGERTTQYIFNPHPWPVEADVTIYHPVAVAGIESLEIRDEDGAPLPQQPLSELRHPRYAGSLNDEHRLVRLTLPPLGYRRVQIVEQPEAAAAPPAPPANGIVELGDMKLTYRNHALREITDRRSGKRYAARDGAPIPRLAFHGLDNQNWVFAGPETHRHTLEPHESRWIAAGPLRWHHRSSGTLGPYAAQVDTIVADNGREVHVSIRLEGNWQQPPETGFVTLSLDVDAGGAVMVDVPFAVEPRDPDHDVFAHNLPAGRDIGIDAMFERLRPGFFWARSWADWSGDGYGVTSFSVDGNHYWLKEPGLIGHVLVRAINLVPDSWEDRCARTLTGNGVQNFSYVFRFHDGEPAATQPQRRAAELRHPLRVVRADSPATPSLPAQHSFLQLDGPAVLSAYYPDGAQRIVRIAETSGAGGRVTITLDRAPETARLEDLVGNPIDQAADVRGATIVVELRPWQIATLRIG
jgi:hypothetical protein